MGTGRGSITRRNRRIPYEGVDVAGLGCVMHKPAGIGVAKVFQSGQYAGVQLQAARHRQSVHDCSSGELVPEGDLFRLHGE
jgi:hypothetical protein